MSGKKNAFTEASIQVTVKWPFHSPRDDSFKMNSNVEKRGVAGWQCDQKKIAKCL